ncbi:hypothetical protein Asi03nite_03110 [Actinoplanes siamensis]|uniref:WD40 repeat protein n=1 Tax=Actinoplanes siamensis TaxID=1223317 RepID=A0A919N2Z9_9ACTN|nr:hypothetical protein Asi03nite_03110 [Actinoplanes siamensis]
MLGATLCLLALLVSACDDETAGLLVDGATAEAGYPAGPVVWLPDGVYYLANEPGRLGGAAQLYRTIPGHPEQEPIHFANASWCQEPYPRSLRRLPEGGLGAVMDCPYENKPTYLAAIDPPTGVDPPTSAVRRLPALDGGADGIWSEAEGRGWTTYDVDGCTGLAPLDRKGRQRMPALEPAALLPWDLDAAFATPPPESCAATGAIGFPAPAPTMSKVVVLASSGETSDWQLYEVDLTAKRIRLVGGHVTAPRGLAVTGDRAVVVGDQGVAVVSLTDGSTTSLTTGNFDAPALSPDGRSVALVEHPGRGAPRLVTRRLP